MGCIGLFLKDFLTRLAICTKNTSFSGKTKKHVLMWLRCELFVQRSRKAVRICNKRTNLHSRVCHDTLFGNEHGMKNGRKYSIKTLPTGASDTSASLSEVALGVTVVP